MATPQELTELKVKKCDSTALPDTDLQSSRRRVLRKDRTGDRKIVVQFTHGVKKNHRKKTL
jgi:hypothetical protein